MASSAKFGGNFARSAVWRTVVIKLEGGRGLSDLTTPSVSVPDKILKSARLHLRPVSVLLLHNSLKPPGT